MKQNASQSINDIMRFLADADAEGYRAGKTELVRLAFGANYAFGLGVISALEYLGYAETINSQDKRWLRITAKGLNYVRSLS